MTFNTHFCISTKATTLKQPDLLKISQIILSYPLADYFEFRACLADRCLCSQNINKYSNKHANECIQKNDSKSVRQSGYFRCQTCPVLQSSIFAKVMSTCFEHKVIKCANVENNLHIYFTQIKQGGFTFKLICSQYEMMKQEEEFFFSTHSKNICRTFKNKKLCDAQISLYNFMKLKLFLYV